MTEDTLYGRLLTSGIGGQLPRGVSIKNAAEVFKELAELTQGKEGYNKLSVLILEDKTCKVKISGDGAGTPLIETVDLIFTEGGLKDFKDSVTIQHALNCLLKHSMDTEEVDHAVELLKDMDRLYFLSEIKF